MGNFRSEFLWNFQPELTEQTNELICHLEKNTYPDTKKIIAYVQNTYAVKYTQQGTITVTADIAGNSLKIIINDTGIGMKQDYLSRVFSPFQQVEMVLIRTHSGTGLGLYLSKKLATLMGGDITAKSKYGTGSEFTYTTPIKIVS